MASTYLSTIKCLKHSQPTDDSLIGPVEIHPEKLSLMGEIADRAVKVDENRAELKAMVRLLLLHQ